MYDIEENSDQKHDEVEITEIPVETWEEATERKDKETEKKWLSE